MLIQTVWMIAVFLRVCCAARGVANRDILKYDLIVFISADATPFSRDAPPLPIPSAQPRAEASSSELTPSRIEAERPSFAMVYLAKVNQPRKERREMSDQKRGSDIERNDAVSKARESVIAQRENQEQARDDAVQLPAMRIVVRETLARLSQRWKDPREPRVQVPQYLREMCNTRRGARTSSEDARSPRKEEVRQG